MIENGHPRRCRARLSDGSRRCKRWAIAGGTTCPAHGGSAPQVKRSARERLDALAEPAITALSAALDRVQVHPQIALHPGVQRAITTVLDRTGYPRATRLEIEEHETRVSEAQGEELARVLIAALGHLGIDADEARVRRALGAALRGEDVAESNGHRSPEPPAAPPREPERMVL